MEGGQTVAGRSGAGIQKRTGGLDGLYPFKQVEEGGISKGLVQLQIEGCAESLVMALGKRPRPYQAVGPL